MHSIKQKHQNSNALSSVYSSLARHLNMFNMFTLQIYVEWMAVFVYYMYEIYLILHRKHAVKLLSFQFFGSVGCLFSNNVARLLVLILFRLNVAVHSISCVYVFLSLFIFFLVLLLLKIVNQVLASHIIFQLNVYHY